MMIQAERRGAMTFPVIKKVVEAVGLTLFWAMTCFAQEARLPVKVEGKELLPLRVLARPFSNVYQDKDTTVATVQENVPVFQPFYVYTRPTPEELEMEEGWYEVGTDNRGKVLGWMQAKDVFEWKQTMCLAYTHPEGRKPVLMFDRKTFLEELIKSPSSDRVKKAEELYQIIDSRQIPENFPVESVEPKKAIDITQQFYLLPILNFQAIDIEGREGRLLRLAAATSSGADARQQTDIRKNPDFVKEATTGAAELSAEQLKKLSVDLVWVIDTTVSMRPYIDKTLEVVKEVSMQLAQDQEVAQGIRFGVWGYRDCADEIPGIEYTTKNYTPQLQSIDQFTATLATVEVTKIDSVDYPEDVFSGVDDAIYMTAWAPEAMHIVVLVGDAPGHELGHKWNLSMFDENTLRSIADDVSVYLFALHVREPKAKKYHEPAEIQFRALSRNPGMSDKSAYWATDSNDLEGFSRATIEITAAILDALQSAKHAGGDETAQAGAVKPGPEPSAVEAPTVEVIQVKPVSVAADGEHTNDPNLIVDNEFAEEGSPWDGETNVSWNGPLTTFVIDLGQVYDIDHLVFQFDTNDSYAVEGSLDGVQYSKFLWIGSSLGAAESGMETMSNQATHPKFIQEQDQPAQARYLKVYAVAGDDNYAVSEIQIFAQKPKEGSADPSLRSEGELGSLEPPQAPANEPEQALSSAAPTTPPAATEQTTAGSLAQQMMRAALVEWIGRQAQARAPRDIVAWAVDKDLIDPAIPSMEVRLLINKRQLDSLKSILTEMMAAGRRGQISGEDFFSALQATAATAARDPNQIKNARSMAQTGLIPEFLEGLPYKSRLMDMSNELWGSWSIDEQDQFLNEVEARIRAYQQIHDRPEGWIALNQGDDAEDHVYPISLEMLP